MKSLKGNRSKNLNSDDSLTDEGIQEMSNEDDSSHRASRFRGDRDSMPSHRRLQTQVATPNGDGKTGSQYSN